MARSLDDLRDDFRLHLWPGQRYLAVYGATGLLAGMAALPFEYSFSRWSLRSLGSEATLRLNSTFLKNVAPGFIAKSGVRFFAFGQFKHIRDVKREMGTNTWPKWVDSAVSGAAAGLVETVIANRVTKPLSGFPPIRHLVQQPARLFMCFGTFGYLSTTFSSPLSREKGMKAWEDDRWKRALSAMFAGGLGTAVTSAAEGLRGKQLWFSAIPKGAFVIGTVIFVQVESSTVLLERFRAHDEDNRRLGRRA